LNWILNAKEDKEIYRANLPKGYRKTDRQHLPGTSFPGLSPL